MSIPNLAPGLLQQLAAERASRRENEKQRQFQAEQAKEQFLRNLGASLLDTGLGAAVKFGEKAYDEATTGKRAQTRLDSDLAQVKRQNEASDLEFAAKNYPLFSKPTPADVPAAPLAQPAKAPMPPNVQRQMQGFTTEALMSPELEKVTGPLMPKPPVPVQKPIAPPAPAPVEPQRPWGGMTFAEKQAAIAGLAGKLAADKAAAKAEQTKWDRSKAMEQEKTKRNEAAVSANVAPVKYDKYMNPLMTRPKTFTGTSDSEWGGLVEYKPTEVQQPVRTGGGGGGEASGSGSMPAELADVKLTLQYANVDKKGRPDGKTISVNAFNGPAIVRILRSTPIQFNLTPGEAASVLDAYQAGNFDVANRMLVASTEALSKGKANIGQAATTSDVDVKRAQELDDAREQAKADLEAAKAERAQADAYATADKRVRAQFVAYLQPKKAAKKNQFLKSEPALPPPINGVQMSVADVDAALSGAEPLDPAKKPGYDKVKADQAAARAEAAGKVPKPKAPAPRAAPAAPAPQAATAAAPSAPAKSGPTNANGVPLSDPRIKDIYRRYKAKEIKKEDLDDWIDGVY